MSEDVKLTWACEGDVYYLVGWPYRKFGPMVRKRAQGWAWVIAPHHESQYAETLEGAQLAALEASLVAVRPLVGAAEAELRRIKQAAQDVADAALVAAHGEVAWAVSDAGFATLHTATVAGHPCCVEVYEGGDAKWHLEPEYYGHPHTWDAPDVETAKIRSAAAALRTPCKRWRVTIQPKSAAGRTMQGGVVEVWAVTREGAEYRGAAALNMRFFGGCPVYGEAVEIEP